MTKMQYNSALQWLQSAGIETQSSKFALCYLNLQYNGQHNGLTHSANCKSKRQLTPNKMLGTQLCLVQLIAAKKQCGCPITAHPDTEEAVSVAIIFYLGKFDQIILA